jgi:hypothetical protein
LSYGLDDKLQVSSLCLGSNGDVRNGSGEIFTDIIEKALKIDVRFGLSGKSEIEVGFAGQAGFLANKPLDICFDRERGGYFFVIRDRESCEQECFLFVSVTDERGEKDFFWKWKLERASGPSRREFPCDRGGETGVPRVFPINVPTRYGIEAKSEGDRFSGIDGGRFCDKIDGKLGGFCDRTCPKWTGEHE